eukprot:Seg298.10 transcript_id=Seg298.10/GoldUCD/mRNA.D3Y31 product=Elongin-B protein_id=Seg298.10/GoldUCD/D3Y31
MTSQSASLPGSLLVIFDKKGREGKQSPSCFPGCSGLIRLSDINKEMSMEVFLMVKRKKLSMFLDGKVTTTVLEIKKMIQGITRKAPEEQQLYLDSEKKLMEDNKTLGDYGITNQTAKAQSPALLVVAYYQNEEGDFEQIEVAPLSQPPEPPEVMKQESSIIQ